MITLLPGPGELFDDLIGRNHPGIGPLKGAECRILDIFGSNDMLFVL